MLCCAVLCCAVPAQPCSQLPAQNTESEHNYIRELSGAHRKPSRALVWGSYSGVHAEPTGCGLGPKQPWFVSSPARGSKIAPGLHCPMPSRHSGCATAARPGAASVMDSAEQIRRSPPPACAILVITPSPLRGAVCEARLAALVSTHTYKECRRLRNPNRHGQAISTRLVSEGGSVVSQLIVLASS
jgi:hypothetical protein